jgi:hypothetical protein
MDKSKNLPPESIDNFWKYFRFFLILMTIRTHRFSFFFRTQCVWVWIPNLFFLMI